MARARCRPTIVPFPWNSLPRNHLVWKLLRIRRVVAIDDYRSSLAAISSRLHSHPHEARQMIVDEFHKRSNTFFLHLLCGHDFGNIDKRYFYMNGRESASPPYSDAEIQLLRDTVEAFPEAIRIADSQGFYPLHIICRHILTSSGGVRMQYLWHSARTEAFNVVFNADREIALKRVSSDGSTALHLLLDSNFGECTGDDNLECVKALLHVFPGAVRVKNSAGLYPFEVACRSANKFCKEIAQLLLNDFPRSAEVVSQPMESNRSPLLSVLSKNCFGAAGAIIDACPWTAGYDDKAVLRLESDRITPSGDSLDYIGVRFCEELGLDEMYEAIPRDDSIFAASAEGMELFGPYRFYVEWNLIVVDALEEWGGGNLGDCVDPCLKVARQILQAMRAKPQFLLLHAAVKGCSCRPWHLVLIWMLCKRHQEQASVRDDDGNLPLHLFLKSCMLEADRAIERGYVRDVGNYRVAVKKGFELILGANPDAVKATDGDDRLPLHLAVTNRALEYDDAIAPLLKLAPRALACRDIQNGLYPFAASAVGGSAKLDVIFRLLREDPSTLLKSQVPDMPTHGDDSKTMAKRRLV